MKEFIKIHPEDNVAVALAPLSVGRTLVAEDFSVTLAEDIPQGHKFSLTHIPESNEIIKYGCPIGLATQSIPCGSWIHTHNLRTGLGDLLTYTYQKNVTELAATPPCSFLGYRRAGGKVGMGNRKCPQKNSKNHAGIPA